VKRRGFTLIELMVVIAIIIILAAIAIPNYLTMTKRAKNSRLASDMSTLATVLETFKTDWGAYPASSTAFVGVSVTTSPVYMELAGTNHTGATYLNIANATNAIGEKNPASWSATTPFQNYIKEGTLKSIINPFGLPAATPLVYYRTFGSGSSMTWTLYAQTDTATWLVRRDSSSTVSNEAVLPTS